MDANRKRRAQRLGTGKPDPDLEVQAMTDEKLLAAFYEDPTAPPEPKPKGSLYEQWLRGLTDDELLAHYESLAEETAATAELARRRPTPEPATLPVPVIVEPPLEPHPIALEVQEPTPMPTPSPTPPGGHVSVAVEGCDCIQCAVHRDLAREEARDRALAQMYEDEPMVEGSVVWQEHQSKGAST